MNLFVNLTYASKKCSNCSCVINSLRFSDRTFFCPKCTWKSLNILKSGLGESVVPEEGESYIICNSLNMKEIRKIEESNGTYTNSKRNTYSFNKSL